MLHRALVMIAFLALAPVCARAADVPNNLASLQVTVLNVSPKGGDILMGLYDRKAYTNNDDDAAVKDVKVPAMPSKTMFTIKDIVPGIYAIKMMQDVNRNGKFDQSWIGLPLEPYGFSNDAKPFLKAPNFSAVKFAIVPGANAITIHLQ